MSRNKTFTFTTIVLVLVVAELICAVALRVTRGTWIYTEPPNSNYALFEPDRDLVGVPRKNIDTKINGIVYRHNAHGFRGRELEEPKVKKRIVCIGGSTTYGVGVSNNETWPYYLDSLLQPEYEVLNLGIPGHSSVEHKKLLPIAIKEYEPDAVVVHCGLNDLRNMHVTDLGHDYAHFHQPSLHAGLGFCMQDRLPGIAMVHVVYHLLQKMKVVSACPFRNEMPAGTLSDSIDERVVQTFSHNLDTMLLQCAEANIPVYLVPQVLSQDTVTDENLKWWIPYLTEKGIFAALDTMNGVLRGKADGMHVCFVDLQGQPWTNKDFYDPSHLNAKGDRKLAGIVAGSIQEEAQ